MKKKVNGQANYIKIRYSFWSELFVIALIFGCLVTLQAFLFGVDLVKLATVPRIVWFTLYCFIVGAMIYAFTAFVRRRAFDKPLMELSTAAKKVADGDFSVFVAPAHRVDKMDYMDVMFDNFNKMVEELGSIETLKTDFFSNVSHEIKTPLAVIQNYATALQNENITVEQRKEYTNTILASSKRLTELITNMLKLSKLEKQTIQPETEPYDVCRQLCDCAIQFEDLWEKKNIEFVTDIEDRATIDADKSLLELVWNNLLSNALKFTPPGGTVTLKQTSEEDAVVVSVSDTGCGMGEETIKHIFEKFYQGDTSHSSEGNGLGLALVLRVLQLIGGSITVKSELEEGTVFTIRLPVCTQENLRN